MAISERKIPTGKLSWSWKLPFKPLTFPINFCQCNEANYDDFGFCSNVHMFKWPSSGSLKLNSIAFLFQESSLPEFCSEVPSCLTDINLGPFELGFLFHSISAIAFFYPIPPSDWFSLTGVSDPLFLSYFSQSNVNLISYFLVQVTIYTQ